MFEAESLREVTGGKWHGMPVGKIEGFSYDTRLIKKGEIFLALKTEARDGHAFLLAAEEAGAVGAIVERVNKEVSMPQLEVEKVLEAYQKIAREHRKEFKGEVVGITGSCGKTTTKDMLALFLEKEGVHKTQVNLNNLLGVPSTLTGIGFERHRYCVVEAGMNVKGEMEVLGSMIMPDVGVITSIDRVHAEGVGEIEAIAEEKEKLLKYLKPDGIVFMQGGCLEYEVFKKYLSRAYVIAREERRSDLLKKQEGLKVIGYWSEVVGSREIMLSVNKGEDVFKWVIPVMSEGMLSNAVMAISVAMHFGVSQQEIQECFSRWQPSVNRGVIEERGGRSFYVDCYNANPRSMQDAFVFFKEHFDAQRPRLYVLGCMGELGEGAEGLHVETGRLLKLRENDRVVIVGPHKEFFAQGIIEAGADVDQIKLIDGREEMQAELDMFQGDVLLKGSSVYRLWELEREELEDSIL